MAKNKKWPKKYESFFGHFCSGQETRRQKKNIILKRNFFGKWEAHLKTKE